jgi:hypothetical protein
MLLCSEGAASIHHRHIQPEFQRAEAGADILRDADDRRGQAAADLTGLGQILAVGQADDRTGKEGVACAGVSMTSTFLAGTTPHSPVCLAYTAP